MTFQIITLGCKVNTYESNVMRDRLLNEGYVEVEDAADIYIVNTCTVTDTSDHKSLKMVRQCIRKNPKILVVVGCMTQVNKELANIDGVSIILGNRYKSNIVDFIKEYHGERIIKVEDIMDSPFEHMVLNNFNRTRAFVKIEDGCENYCSYCIIPYSRGKVRSKDPKIVLDEIKTLVKDGHKEIVLTGIHTGHYGSDLGDYHFSNLLNDIVDIDGLERLRISSIEITEIDQDVLDVMQRSNVIVDHIHIPIQNGSDEILKSMNRKYDKEYFIKKVEEIRRVRPNISLTTDLIVGFPGETEENFKETIETVKKINFSKIHVFPFSLRKGTKAEELPNHIDERTKKDRVLRLIEVSRELEIDYMSKYIGEEVEIIPEMYKDGYIYGHTGNYLSVKAKYDKLVHDNLKVKVINVCYPNVIAEVINV